MSYSIVAYFDEISDTRIKSLWNGLGDIGVDDYLINFLTFQKENRTLNFYNSILLLQKIRWLQVL